MADSSLARVVDDSGARAILEAARGQGLELAASQIAARFQKLETPRASVFVVGRTRVGKSSVINGILGRTLLPTDSVPCTGAVVEVAGANAKSLEVELVGGRRITDDPGAIRKYASEEENPGNIRQVARVTAYLPDPVLDTGLHVFDTPGTESLHPLHERVLLDSLLEADCALFVYRAPDLLPGQKELELLRKVQRGTGRLFVVQNEAHDLAPESAEATLAAVRKDLTALGIQIHGTFRVRARRPEHETFTALRQALVKLGFEDAPGVKRRAVARSLLWLGQEAEARLAVQERALADPLAKVEARLEHQARTLDEIRDRVKRVRAGARLAAQELRRGLDLHVQAIPNAILGGRTAQLFAPGAELVGVSRELEGCVNDALAAWLQRADEIVKAGHARVAELARQQLRGVDDQLSELAGAHFRQQESTSAFGDDLHYRPDFVSLNPSALAKVGAYVVVFVRASAGPIAKLAGAAAAKKIGKAGAAAVEHGVRMALEALADRLETPVASEGDRIAAIKKELEAQIAALRDDLTRQVASVVLTAENGWEESLRLHYDSRISLLDEGVRRLVNERRTSQDQARTRLDDIRRQLATVRGASAALQKVSA